MHRTLVPELLDALAADDPAMGHIRRDLRIINWALGNFEWFAEELAVRLSPGERVLEIGAGTGELGQFLSKRGVPIDGLDRMPRPNSWPDSSQWIVADLRSFEGYSDYAAIIGNLIFHQFSASELAALGQRLAGARLILASEPSRRRISQWICAAAAPIVGAHQVTRHDAHVSIASGFRDNELPRALGFAAPVWDLNCRMTGMGAYRLVATRRP